MAAEPNLARGAWLRSAALKVDVITADDAAAVWDVSRQAAARWLHGYPIRDSKELRRVANHVGCTVSMLVEGPWPALTPPLDAETVLRCVAAVEKLGEAVRELTARVATLEHQPPGEEVGQSARGRA